MGIVESMAGMTESPWGWVQKQAVELHLRCMQEIKPARNPRTGKQLCDDDGNGLFTFNAGAANRALALIGKHVDIQAFRENIQVSSGPSLVERIQAGRARVAKMSVEDAEVP